MSYKKKKKKKKDYPSDISKYEKKPIFKRDIDKKKKYKPKPKKINFKTKERNKSSYKSKPTIKIISLYKPRTRTSKSSYGNRSRSGNVSRYRRK